MVLQSNKPLSFFFNISVFKTRDTMIKQKKPLLSQTEATKIDEKIPTNNAGAIAGGVVGSAAVILIIIVGILFLRYQC